jgi:pimeloyl-ACP methyl ester carboxylesterase
MTCDPVVILGGFFSTRWTYWEMQPALEKLTRQKVYVVPATRLDWAVSTSAFGWTRILKKLDLTVKTVRLETGAKKVVLIGHSLGGVMARLYLSPKPFCGRAYAGVEVVSSLVTLGSPHRNDRGSFLRRWVEKMCPGACFAPAVRYMSVAGKALLGDRGGKAEERAAYRNYELLCGQGDVWGDGRVPLCSALLEGATPVILDGVFHFSRVGGRPWYGNTRVVRRWWEASQQCLSEEEKGENPDSPGV